jgi:hypothetical protein
MRILGCETLPPWLLHHVAMKLTVTPALPISSRTISHLSASFPIAEKRERRNIFEKIRGGLFTLRGIISLSLLFHGGVGLACVGGHARAPAKPRELGVMTMVELATYHVPEDPTSPTPVG